MKTENRPGTAQNNPYLAFRRRTEKMQTRKNRKNDESSYEKMLKLRYVHPQLFSCVLFVNKPLFFCHFRRDLSRAVTLLEMIKRREKAKREQMHLGIEIFEKRYQASDFSGQLISEFTTNVSKSTRYCLQSRNIHFVVFARTKNISIFFTFVVIFRYL